MKSNAVSYDFDADILGLGKLIASLRPDSTYPGDPGATIHKRVRPPCPIESPAVHDPVWIPLVAERGWLIVTRDSRIQTHRAEIDAVRTSGARMVALAAPDARGTWQQLETLMRNWRRMEAQRSRRSRRFGSRRSSDSRAAVTRPERKDVRNAWSSLDL